MRAEANYRVLHLRQPLGFMKLGALPNMTVRQCDTGTLSFEGSSIKGVADEDEVQLSGGTTEDRKNFATALAKVLGDKLEE